ncbi:choice-of-anchor M domain-containing protein, partial [Conexibacter sp. JD483]|uniref:choice-of-anchor M domain-containing protein n=2 Tax=Conexibacter TaxID=191494 RepID=UPI00286FDC72
MTARLRVLAVLVLLGGAAPSASAAGGLDQRIARGQALAAGRAQIAGGHVDVGPRFVDGRWTLLIHDDAAASRPGGHSVWRRPERTVLRVRDAARQTVPDDPAYGFLHVPAGREVFVVPQTQDPRVVWVGWNTQDPAVMERIDRGVRLTLTGVEGPGALVVFLQSGDFSAPQRLWDSSASARPLWVDVNTHTHANWVFTKPGVHLVHVRVAARLIDGTTVSDTRALRFAVGEKASAQEAFAAVDAGAGEDDAADPRADAEGRADADGHDADASDAAAGASAEPDAAGPSAALLALLAALA